MKWTQSMDEGEIKQNLDEAYNNVEILREKTGNSKEKVREQKICFYKQMTLCTGDYG